MNAKVSNRQERMVWDIPVRVFHWLIVLLVCFSWYSIEIAEDLDWHFMSGYCVLAMLIFRIAWGFIGTRNARFRHMLYAPAAVRKYVRSLFKRGGAPYAGHNPLGGLSAFVLLVLLILQAGSGLFSNDEEWYFGPLSDYVSTKTADRLTEFHHLNFNVLTGFIVLHIAAVLFYHFYKKENLIRAMLTGKKFLPANSAGGISQSKLATALLTIACAASAVYLLATFA